MNESSYNNVLNYRHKRDDEEPDSQESVWRRTDGVGKRMVSVGLVQFAQELGGDSCSSSIYDSCFPLGLVVLTRVNGGL